MKICYILATLKYLLLIDDADCIQEKVQHDDCQLWQERRALMLNY